MLKWKHYFEGKLKILQARLKLENGKINYQVMVNYCKTIVDNYRGYLTGTPASYTSEKDISDIIDILKSNQVYDEDGDLLNDALVYGKAFEINWINEQGKLRFRTVSPLQCIDIYSADLDRELLYVVRVWKELLTRTEEEKWWIEVYSKDRILKYILSHGFASMMLVEDTPHFYKNVPVSVLILNEQEESIFNQILTLQDAYNLILSDECSDFSSWCDAYLLLKGVIADSDDLASMKANRCLMMDSDASAEFLTKEINDAQVENLLKNINDLIFKKSNCVDFTDDKFGVSSGIALRYRLLGFENSAGAIANNLKRALQNRILLISNILSLTSDDTEMIDIVINRNLPVDDSAIAQELNALRGLVSTKTLLSQIPFILDAEEEYKKLQEEQLLNRELYGFGNESDEEEEDA